MKANYERIIQWAAGPVSILSGWLATQITNHVALFGHLGIGHSQVGSAVFNGVVFAVSAAVTYAAHHKWLTNLATYWKLSGVTDPAGVTAAAAEVTRELDTETPEQTAEKLRAQLRAHGVNPGA